MRVRVRAVTCELFRMKEAEKHRWCGDMSAHYGLTNQWEHWNMKTSGVASPFANYCYSVTTPGLLKLRQTSWQIMRLLSEQDVQGGFNVPLSLLFTPQFECKRSKRTNKTRHFLFTFCNIWHFESWRPLVHSLYFALLASVWRGVLWLYPRNITHFLSLWYPHSWSFPSHPVPLLPPALPTVSSLLLIGWFSTGGLSRPIARLFLINSQDRFIPKQSDLVH